MNVLLTCAGRRNYLIKAFQEALQGKGRVIAADSQPEAPALQEADRGFALPPVHHPEYAQELLQLCRDQQIGLVVPLNDLELPRLAQLAEQLREIGTRAVISSPSVIDCCGDKLATFQFLRAQGIPTPGTFLDVPSALAELEQGKLAWPLIVKPRWGSGSIGIELAHDPEELLLAYRFAGKSVRNSCLMQISQTDPQQCLLIQERIAGQEYGLDIINDLAGRYVTTFIKRKLSMRAGETDRAITIHDPQLEALGEQIGQALGHVGNLDCDVILGNDGPQVLELNPRFGGSYPFSHLAGANLPAALLAWARGETPRPEWLRVRENITSAKCDRLVEC
jgi:carbamoyl-phosphate synthase large subunit